jgi:hypothetical protein
MSSQDSLAQKLAQVVRESRVTIQIANGTITVSDRQGNTATANLRQPSIESETVTRSR